MRTWVLQGREVPMVVRVPSEYTAQDLVDLAKPINEAIAGECQRRPVPRRSAVRTSRETSFW